VITIANIALFLLTQDFTASPLVVMDIWSVPITILFILGILFGRLAKGSAKASNENMRVKKGKDLDTQEA
jgi:Sec-independent protein secretion pathway component TatC